MTGADASPTTPCPPPPDPGDAVVLQTLSELDLYALGIAGADLSTAPLADLLAAGLDDD